jgi:hypothetical protein
VTLTLGATEVAAGRDLEALLRYRNTTDAPLALRFLRNERPSLGFRAPDGSRLPIEGRDRCVVGGTISAAELRGVWLAPGAVIHAPLTITTRRERRVNGGAGEFDCDVEPASPLPVGRYQLVLEWNALFAANQPAPVSFQVVRR